MSNAPDSSDSTEIRLTIGDFALLTRLSRKALRFYDSKGLLTPMRDDLNNYRYYSTDQIEIGLKIRLLGWMGFGLAEIKELLHELEDQQKNHDKLEQRFKGKLHEVEIEIQRLSMVKNILRGEKVYEVLSMKVTEPEIKEIPKMRVLTKREIGPIQPTIQKLFGELMHEIFKPDNQRGQVSINGAPFLIVHQDIEAHFKRNPDINYEELHERLVEEIDENMGNLDVECGIPIIGRIQVEDNFELKYLPEGKVVSVLFTGPYAEIEGAYATLFRFLSNNQFEMAGPSREFYLNDPNEVPQDKLLTEIQFPIKS